MKWSSSTGWSRALAGLSLAILLLPVVILAISAILGNDTDSMAFGFAFTLLVIIPCSGALAVLALAALVLRLTHTNHPGQFWWVPLAAATVWTLGFLALFLGTGL